MKMCLPTRGVVLLVLVGCLAASSAFAGSNDNPPPLPGWTHSPAFSNDSPQRHGILLEGNDIIRGSPVIGELSAGSAGLEVAVGGSDGRVYVYAANGSRLWSAKVPTGCSLAEQINSAPAIGQLYGDGVGYLVVSYGTINGTACDGGVIAYRGSDGAENWRYSLKTKTPSRPLHGVISSPALADTDGDGRMEVGFGGFDHFVHILNADGTDRVRFDARDTIWSSPAFVNIDGDAQLEMVIGTDISGGASEQGGYVYAFDTDAAASGKFIWRTFFDQVIYSSPAIGDVLPANAGAEIVVGTGCSFPVGQDNKRGKYIKILRLSDGAVLQTLNAEVCVQSSPALGDIDDDGILEVVATLSGDKSIGGSGSSHLVAWDATNPSPKWSIIPRNVDGANDQFGGDLQSPVIADLDGNGSLEVAVANVWSVGVYAGKTGAALTCQSNGCGTQTSLFAWFSLKSTPAVGDINQDGQLDLVIGGSHFHQRGRGLLYAWTGFAGKINSLAGTQQANITAWPMFRNNAQHTGVYSFVARKLQASPSSISTLSLLGAPRTIPVSISFTDGSAISWTATETDAQNIIALSPASGSGTTKLQVTVDPSATPGTYTASIRVQASGQILDIPVKVTVATTMYQANLPSVLR